MTGNQVVGNRTVGSRAMGIERSVFLRPITLGLGITLAAALFASIALADGQFSPVVKVNDQVVTRYELDQRIAFMTLLQQPGDIEAEALKTLIEDRLRFSLAKQFGVVLPPEQIESGMAEFASRANLSVEEFVAAIGQAGVEPQAFRDFVEAGIIWREIVRAKFGPSTTVSEADIDRALAGFKPVSALQLALSEIVLPAAGAERVNALALARKLRAQSTTTEAFAEAARAHSKGRTARSGGVLGWMPARDLPKDAVAPIRALAPGQVSTPVVSETEVRLYFLRETREEPLRGTPAPVVDYAEFLIPDDGNADAEWARVRGRVDRCDDLYAVAQGLPADRLTRAKRVSTDLPRDTAAVLTLMDPGETNLQIRRGGWRVMMMLCSRQAAEDQTPTREQVRIQLLNQRLQAQAELFLEELRTEAVIVEY
jgi:peptidyl-prolyl cis-trans isomerase SurA